MCGIGKHGREGKGLHIGRRFERFDERLEFGFDETLPPVLLLGRLGNNVDLQEARVRNEKIGI